MSDRPRGPGELWLAPSAAASAEVARFPSHHDDLPLPAVDDHIVEPETRWEMLDGELIYAEPAEPPHAEAHSQLDFIVRGLAAPGYKTASDMLTRTGHRSNFAPDASIFSAERDPVTKGRKLEELAFEVVSEQSLQVPTRKARQLVERGVRRVFSILVGKQKVLEWSREADGWVELPEQAEIADRCLIRPLPVRALLDAAVADNTVARALEDKHNPVIEQIKAGAAALAKAQDILAVLRARGVEVSTDSRARILATQDLELLDRWITRAAVADAVEHVFDEGTLPRT